MGTEMRVGADGVAVITLKNPPVNALSKPVLRDLRANFEEATRRDDVKALVLIGAGGKFCGGADISEFKEHHKHEGAVVHRERISVDLMTHLIEDAKKPSVAAIEGLALGGGLELAMCCSARVAAPTALLGLPEQQLGIIPGYGGTQRLPRLIGLLKAIQMILLSKPVTSVEGKDLGLVDAIAMQGDLLDAARAWALDIARGQRPWLSSLHRTDKLEPLREARTILKAARNQVRKASPNVRYPHICLDAIEAGVVAGGCAGLLKEKAAMEVMTSDTSKALVHVFFAQRATSKVPGVTDISLKPKAIKKVAVVGGGFIGSGIVTMLILRNIPVLLKEVDSNALVMSFDKIKANLHDHVKKEKLPKEKFDKTFSLVKGVLDYNDFKTVDLVIEAVIEDVAHKQQIFQDLEIVCAPTCILATSTSTIGLKVVGATTDFLGRIVGLHFFGPADEMPLLEIVRADETSPQVVFDSIHFGKILKKVPVVVSNCTGSAVNRILFMFFQAALFLVDLGLDPYQIDGVVDVFGMPKGPFRLLDFVGLKLGVQIGLKYSKDYPDHTYVSNLILSLVEDGHLGTSSGQGFYLYDHKGKAQHYKEVKTYMANSRQFSNLLPQKEATIITDKDILEMVLFPVVNEACRLLHEKITIKASDVDIASIVGLGFPPYRGGLIFWADSIGANYVYSKLSQWAVTFGTFFKPSSFLEERANEGTPLGTIVQDSKSRL
ncbi:hypothetical protein O6H91_09G032900 [Diphasiastrum complanatum]|uniref:Uncharacterized protein n=1 Tax=Diphasiastrum complanatum TaxID=34168 RepID=A0ACC2CNP4_DIPCM|nr:hypothetical protein O6H91_09G032900 [Diphasiastrum complanatum]